MSLNKKKGNVTLACLVAALVVVIAAIILLPDGSKPAGAEVAAEVEDEYSQTTLVKEGMEAPDFTVEMVDGSLFTLSEQRGNVVLVNFWATWCPPCREELSHVQSDIVDRFAGRPFRMVAISRGEARETVEEFLSANGYRFPAALDPEQTVYQLFASNYIPRNFLIDADGKVVFTGIGYEEEEFAELTEMIENTLNNQ
ncbi:MAG: TlpA family protein disulfide reductase [Alistipes sp.]|nr:TlpA family protein disulfide reductase [Alistipes sp.]